MPGLGRVSRREKTKTLPALHVRMELHLRNHAAFTRFCTKSGTDPAFAFARLRRNWSVSNDHLPPVSAANTTRRSALSHPLGVPGLFPALRFLQSHPCAPSGSHPAREETPTLCRWSVGSLPQGQPVRDHLNPSSIEATKSSQVEVAHEGVWGHPSPSFPAHLGCVALVRKPPLSQNPCLGAPCTMMAINVQ